MISCQNDKINIQKIAKNWKIQRDIYSKGNLIIKENKEFEFNEKSHLSETFSRGSWIIKRDTLFLKSQIPSECLYMYNFSLYCEKKYILIEELIETTIENCTPNNHTILFTKFQNEKFILRNDSLIYVNSNKNCANKQTNYKLYQ